jgi:hypothetical protein
VIPRNLATPRRAAALLALALTMLAVAGAHATTVLKLDVDALTARSEQIVRGHVVGMEPRLEGGRVSTYVTLRVAERYKGTGGDEVTLRRLGGRVGDVATHVAGATPFTPGEHVLVFLERPAAKDAPLVVTGMRQGKFSVRQGPDGATLYVVPNVDGVRLVAPSTSGGSGGGTLAEADPSPAHDAVWSLQDFTQRVRRAQAGGRP